MPIIHKSVIYHILPLKCIIITIINCILIIVYSLVSRNNRSEDLSPVEGLSWFGTNHRQVNSNDSLDWSQTNNDPDVWPPPTPVEHKPGPQVRPQKPSRRNEPTRVANKNQKVVPTNTRNSTSRSQFVKKNDDVKKGPRKDTNGHNTNGTTTVNT